MSTADLPDQGNTILADPRTRLRSLAVAVMLGTLGLIATWSIQQRLSQIEQLTPLDQAAAAAQLSVLLQAIARVGLATLAVMVVWLWMLGRRIRLANQFPPPGMEVLRDTTLRTGSQAQRMARSVQFIAVFLAASGITAFVLLCRLTASL